MSGLDIECPALHYLNFDHNIMVIKISLVAMGHGASGRLPLDKIEIAPTHGTIHTVDKPTLQKQGIGSNQLIPAFLHLPPTTVCALGLLMALFVCAKFPQCYNEP